MRKSTINILAAATLLITTSAGARAEWGTPAVPGTMIESSTMDSSEMALAPDGSLYVVWTQWAQNGGEGLQICAQRFDADGNKQWGEDGITVDRHSSPTWCSHWNIVVTPESELVISWAFFTNCSRFLREYHTWSIPIENRNGRRIS